MRFVWFNLMPPRTGGGLDREPGKGPLAENIS
jgi:hypothetical protein